MIRWGGVTTAVVASATAACGLLMLSGVGPAPASAADGETIPEPPADVTSADATTPATSAPEPTATVTVPATVASTPSSVPITAPPPIPLSVSPAAITVGVGGTARVSGECPVVDGMPLGPVEIWQIGSTVTSMSTGVTAAAWSYDWTAPSDAEPLALQIWCGDPSAYEGGYPESLQIDVVFVAQEAPTTTTTVAIENDHVIPETD